MELIEHPKRLWKFLSVRVRNQWIIRVIIRKRFKKAFEDHSTLGTLEGDEFKSKAIEYMNKLHFQGVYWHVFKGFLSVEINNCKSLQSIMRTIKQLERNAFRTYFFTVFMNEDENTNKPKSKKEASLNSKKRQKIRGLDDF